MYFHYFIIISPWKRVWPFIWTNLNSHHLGILCAKFGWNWPVVLEKKSKIGKVYRRTDRQTDRRTDGQTTDDRWSEKLTWAFSSGELKSYGPNTNLHRQTNRQTDRQTDSDSYIPPRTLFVGGMINGQKLPLWLISCVDLQSVNYGTIYSV